MLRAFRSDRYRYTLWVGWDGERLSARWDDVWGEELYDHLNDDGSDFDEWENVNLAAGSRSPEIEEVILTLKQNLIAHFDSDQ